MHNPPPSPDCLILVNCIDKELHNLYLIELKDVETLRRLNPDDIVDKFKTMTDVFFVEFADVFKRNYSKAEFYVINPHYKKRRGLELDIVTPSTPLQLYGRAIPIKTSSSLTIMPC
jgi:ABC-type metal ion transport system substrate-binding protein